jgi:diguanylate cyclase
VFVLGNVIQLGIVTRDATSFDAVAGSTAQVVSILVGIGLMIAGMLGYPLGGQGRAERLRLRVDVATVMAAPRRRRSGSGSSASRPVRTT